MVVQKEVFDEAGGFDETNVGISFNDVDFCLRLRAAGFQNVWTPYANLIHHESASRGHQPTDEEQAQFVREATYMQRKWGIELLHDPFYNPNLSQPARLRARCSAAPAWRAPADLTVIIVSLCEELQSLS